MTKKQILITGATAGFGEAMAYRFAKENCNLILTGRRAERLAMLKQNIEAQYNVSVITLQFDVRDKNACAAAFQSLKTQTSRIDVLVNNAGLAQGLGTIDEGDNQDWDTMIDTNVKGLLYVTQEVLPFMKEQKGGHIINIGSTAGKNVYKNGNVYCATKFAVNALSESLRIDMLPYGIKVTTINPGAAETEFSLVRFKGDEDRAKSVYNDFTPLSAQDIADAAWYAISLPKHVCINDITMTCITQASSVYNIKQHELKQ